MCLYDEIKPKLTRSQRALCEAIGIGWLARNKVECSLRWYSEKPTRDMSDGCYKSSGTERIIGVPFPEFPFVKWEDEPYSIEEMLMWESDGVDTIYRQTAIEAVSNLASSMSVCLNTDECHGMKRMQEMAVTVLRGLQSEDQECGHWIYRGGDTTYPEWERYECSECGHHSYRSPYCPYCEKRMVGERF